MGGTPAARDHRVAVRSTVAPLANNIEALHYQRPGVTLTVVVTEVVFNKRTLERSDGAWPDNRLRREWPPWK
jgi:hypothetical protein